MYILNDRERVAWDLYEEKEDCFVYEKNSFSIKIMKETDEVIFNNCDDNVIHSWLIDEVCIPLLINI